MAIRQTYKKKGRRPKHIGIYEIACTSLNKVYIGSSKDISIRWNSHIWNLITTSHVCKLLQQEVKENGIECISFRILKLLDFNTTPKEVREIEQSFMNKYTKDQLLNTKRAMK